MRPRKSVSMREFSRLMMLWNAVSMRLRGPRKTYSASQMRSKTSGDPASTLAPTLARRPGMHLHLVVSSALFLLWGVLLLLACLLGCLCPRAGRAHRRQVLSPAEPLARLSNGWKKSDSQSTWVSRTPGHCPPRNLRSQLAFGPSLAASLGGCGRTRTAKRASRVNFWGNPAPRKRRLENTERGDDL